MFAYACGQGLAETVPPPRSNTGYNCSSKATIEAILAIIITNAKPSSINITTRRVIKIIYIYSTYYHNVHIGIQFLYIERDIQYNVRAIGFIERQVVLAGRYCVYYMLNYRMH